MTPPFARGDSVRLTTHTGREIDAVVQHAARDGRSLVLLFDAMVHGWKSQMPVFEEPDGTWTTLENHPVTLERTGLKIYVPACGSILGDLLADLAGLTRVAMHGREPARTDATLAIHRIGQIVQRMRETGKPPEIT